MVVSGEIFQSISCFRNSPRLKMVLDGMSSLEFAINAGLLQCSIYGPTLFLLCINALPVMILLNVWIHANDTTLYFGCEKASAIWKQLKISFDLG